MENLLTPGKILELLGISKYELQTLIQKNAIPFYRLGRKTIRFNPKEIKEWIEKSRVEVNPLGKG